MYMYKDDKPKMIDFRSFPGQKGKIDLAQGISDHYIEFDRCLLNDNSGEKVYKIEITEHWKMIAINDAVFFEWQLGNGRSPVTWKTFLLCLIEAELIQLAMEIQKVLIVQ